MNVEGSCRGLIRVNTQHFTEGLRKNHEQFSKVMWSPNRGLYSGLRENDGGRDYFGGLGVACRIIFK
jgi:hypothetical protein